MSCSVSWLAALLILLPSGVYHHVKGNCLIAMFVILPVYVREKAYMLSPLSVPRLHQLYPSILLSIFLLKVIIDYYKNDVCFAISYQYLGTHWLGRKLRLFQPLFFQPGCLTFLPSSGTCTINSSLQSTSVPISVLIAIVVFVPFFLIIACYIAIVCTLKASHKKLNTSPQR